MTDDKRYTEEQIREAFFREFRHAGEVWFGGRNSNDEHVEAYWEGIREKLAEVAPAPAKPTVHILIVEACDACNKRIAQAFAAPPTEAQIALAIEAAGNGTCTQHYVVEAEIGGAPVDIHIERD